VISVLDEKCGKSLRKVADHTIIVPSTGFHHTAVIPRLVVGQLFALHLAELNERPIDRPRNLAKSVTVE
jgi:glucosamine--fructose-6-phosphate aminotransferase (isomerizing)